MLKVASLNRSHSVPILFSRHVLSLTLCSLSQHLLALSHSSLPDHSCPGGGNKPHRSCRPGGRYRGRPPLAGSKHSVLNATRSLSSTPPVADTAWPLHRRRARSKRTSPAGAHLASTDSLVTPVTSADLTGTPPPHHADTRDVPGTPPLSTDLS